MTTIQTHCAFRLGDNLLALQLLRALAKKYPDIHFRHAAALCYLQQLAEVVCDLPNLQIVELHHQKGYSVNLWKNAGQFWDNHPLKNDYAAFALEWAKWICPQLVPISAVFVLESPWSSTSDLVFDYPALEAKHCPVKIQPFDILIVNSPPQSGQWRAYDPVEMTTLCQSLAQRNSVVTTHPTGLPIACTQSLAGFTVTNIGQISQLCNNIVMVSTGPSWPTFNIWNRDTIKFRLIFNDAETVNLAPNTDHCHTVAEARKVLQLRGLI